MAVKMKPDIVAPVPTTKEKKPTNIATLIEGDEELVINWKICRFVTISISAINAPSTAPIAQ